MFIRHINTNILALNRATKYMSQKKFRKLESIFHGQMELLLTRLSYVS